MNPMIIDEQEAESFNLDLAEYEEETSTTGQDRYIEQNGYSIRQGESIEQFRNEY